MKSPDTQALLDTIWNFYLPNKTLVVHKPGTASLLTENIEILSSISEVEGKATVYLCENYKCEAPMTDIKKLAKALNPKNSV